MTTGFPRTRRRTRPPVPDFTDIPEPVFRGEKPAPEGEFRHLGRGNFLVVEADGTEHEVGFIDLTGLMEIQGRGAQVFRLGERAAKPPPVIPEEAERERIFEAVFPEEDIEALLRGMAISPEMAEPERVRAEQAQTEFIASIQEIGRTAETEALLRQLGATEEQLEEFFPTLPPIPQREVRPPLDIPAPFPIPETKVERESNRQAFRQYRKQGGKLSFDQWRRDTALRQAEITGELEEDVFRKLAGYPIIGQGEVRQGIFESFIDAIWLEGRRVISNTFSHFTKTLPNQMFGEFQVDLLKADRERLMEAGFSEEALIAREENLRRFNREKRDDWRKIYAQEARNLEEFEADHPELQPPPRFKQDLMENLGLLKEPGYIAHLVGSMIPYTAAVMATTFGTLFLTRNPFAAAAAGLAVATPAVTTDLVDDLEAAGVPEETASLVAGPVGLFIAGIEVFSDILMLKVIAPGLNVLQTGIRKEVVNQTVKTLTKKVLVKKVGERLLLPPFVETFLDEVPQTITQNVVVGFFDENREVLEQVDETIVKTFITSMILFGLPSAATSLVHMKSNEARIVPPEQKKAEGWKQDKVTGEWYKPEVIADTIKKNAALFELDGLSPELAMWKALNEAARTPEGLKVIKETYEKVKAGEELKPPRPIAPEILAEAREKFPIKPPITRVDWERFSVADRAELVQSLGLEAEVATKAWDALLAEERRLLTTELPAKPAPVIEPSARRAKAAQEAKRISVLRKDLARLEREGATAAQIQAAREELSSLEVAAKAPAVPPLTEALVREGEELVKAAEAIQPDNPSLIKFKEFLKQAQESTGQAKLDALKGMEALEAEVREITKAPVVPEKLEAEKPVAPVPLAKKEITPTLINQVRAEQKEILIDVETLRTTIKGKKDIGSRLTRLLLKGTERELRVSEGLLRKIEAGEKVTEEELAKTREILTATRKAQRAKLETIQEQKQSLVDFAKTLPLNVRGKLLSSVKNVQTEKGLAKAIKKAEGFAELNAQKVLKAEIRKEIKRTQAVVKDKILKGKFTPDVQVRLDTISQNLDVDRDIARDKMAENVQKYDDGELSYEEMLKANEALNFAGIEGMSSEELANTLEYIKILKIVGRSERQAKQETATEIIEATRTDISNILTGGQGLKTGIGAVPRRGLAAVPSWLDNAVNWQFGIDDIADKLGKFEQVPDPKKATIITFISQVHRATNRQIIGIQDQRKKVINFFKEVYGLQKDRDVHQIQNELGQEVNLGTFEFTEEYKANHPGATTFTLKMSRDEMIAKFMQMQDSTLNNTFTTGMGWSQKVRDAVEENLTTEEKKLAEAYFEFYEAYYTDVNKIYTELYNVDMPHNPNYSPIRRDLEGDVAENVLTFQDAQQYAAVTAQSIKARTRNIRPLKFNGATQVLANHIEQMEHFKAWATTMRDMRRVFGNPKIRAAVEQYHGAGISKKLDTFFNQMARDGVETAATNRAVDTLRINFTTSILPLKPVIGLKQVPSIFAYISEMNVGDFFAGVANYWSAPIENFKFLFKNSEGFRARVSQGHERDVRAAMEKHGRKKLSGRSSFVEWLFINIRLGDAFAVTQGSWAKMTAELKGMGVTKDTATPEQLREAIEAAEDTTGRTQPSFGIDTLSAFQNAGSWFKLMAMFMNQPNKYFRIEANALRNFRYKRGSRAKNAQIILLVHVILPMLFQYIADAFQWKPERQARAGILGGLNYIFVIGQMVQSVWGWLTDMPFDWRISPVLSTMDEIQKAILKAKKMVNQGLDPYKDITVDDVADLVEYLAKATGQLIGLPTPYFVQVEKQVRKKLQADEDIDIKDFLFSGWALEPPKKNAEEKVEELNFKLGEPEEGAEDKPLTDKPLQIYDTKDWFRDIGKVYKNVLPQDVIDDPNTSKESKAWAEYEIARSKADILPDIPLYKINTEDNDDTILNYYEQWKARERQETLDELNEYDKLYPKAYLGNVTRQQLSLLTKYLESEDKVDFLEKHPELRINPKDEWLKANPIDNARMALAGEAKILTLEAYKEIKKLIKVLDIPDDAIPELTLPPEGSIETHFKYEDMVTEGQHGSWEAQLLLLKDAEVAREAGVESYAEWHDLTLSETPVRSLELKIKHRGLFNQLESLETEEERARLKEDNPQWVDDMRRIDAIENDGSDAIIESWVDRGKVIDEFGAGSSEAKVWLIDNGAIWDWAIKKGLLTDDGEGWNFPVLELNKKLREKDEQYEALATDEEREAFLSDNLQYHEDRRRRDAFGIEGFPDEEVENYVDFYTNPDLEKPEGWDDKLGWYEDDWWLIDHPEFHQSLVDTGKWKELRNFSEVPTRDVFELYQIYIGLPLGQTRRDYRAQHLDLDDWLVTAKGLTPIGDRGDEEADLSRLEKISKDIAEGLERLRKLRE